MNYLAFAAVLVVCQSIALGSALHFKKDAANLSGKDFEKVIHLVKGLTSDHVSTLAAKLMQGFKNDNSSALCKDNMCQSCAELSNDFGKVCITLEYLNKTTEFSLRVEHEIIDVLEIKFDAKSTPEVCVFGHVCVKITDMYLECGELCGTVHLNSYPLFKDHCFKL